MLGSIRRHSLRWLLLAALAAIVAFAHARIPTQRHYEDAETWVPAPELAKLASLGFRNLVADYYWLLGLQIVGGSAQDPSVHGPVIGRIVDLVTTLDPWVDHPYRFAAIWMTDSEESVRKADALMDRGIAHHPDEWRNPFYQGFNRFFYLQEHGAAADALERAASLPGSPAYLPRLVARLRADTDGLDTAAAMLAELVAGAEDPYERAEYEKALDEVETERRARMLDAARAEYQRRHGRDIERVVDLAQGPDAVLRELPPELHGWEWEIDPETDRIVSSWYGYRYEPLLHPSVRRERERRPAGERVAEEEGART